MFGTVSWCEWCLFDNRVSDVLGHALCLLRALNEGRTVIWLTTASFLFCDLRCANTLCPRSTSPFFPPHQVSPLSGIEALCKYRGDRSRGAIGVAGCLLFFLLPPSRPWLLAPITRVHITCINTSTPLQSSAQVPFSSIRELHRFPRAAGRRPSRVSEQT